MTDTPPTMPDCNLDAARRISHCVQRFVRGHNHVTLYNADCLDVLPLACDAVITDPPYGLGDRMQGGTWGAANKYANLREWDVVPADETLAMLAALYRLTKCNMNKEYNCPPVCPKCQRCHRGPCAEVIPYNPPGMDEYIREGARQNSALFARCDDARARGIEDAAAGRGRHENPFGSKPWESAAWLDGYNEVLGRNPIFLEYYSHESCNCYKIKLPWPRFAEEKIVLCRESDGFERARALATEILTDHIGVALMRPNVES
jgi:hypothetical protein